MTPENIQKILDCLQGVKQTAADQWMAICPSHDDKTPSLSIKVGADDIALLCCHACHVEPMRLVKQLGLPLSVLFGKRGGDGHRPSKIVATYPYTDEQGELLFEKVRYEPKRFLQRRPDGSGGWIWKIKGVRRVLFLLPELIADTAANPSSTVFIGNGEKAVLRGREHGLIMTCGPGGEGTRRKDQPVDNSKIWLADFNLRFTGKHVALLADNDTTGAAYADYVARQLHGTAASVRIVNLPGLLPKEDSYNWFEAGGTADKLRAIVQATPEFDPAAPPVIAGAADIAKATETVKQALEKAGADHEPSAAFNAAPALALLDEGACADAIAKFKELVGKNLNTRELKKSIKSAHKRAVRESVRTDKPFIVVNGRQMRDVSAEAIRALADANDPPVIFSRGGSLARIRIIDNAAPSLAQVSEAHMRGRIARVADCIIINRNGEESAVSPPMEFVRDVMAIDLNEYAIANDLNSFPQIDGITAIPVLRPDWSILTEPGYDAATKLYYAPSPTFNMPIVPDSPSVGEIAQAVAVLDEAFGEFPYESDADKANAIGTAITPAIKPAIHGRSPIAIIDAPQAGTGKSLLAEAIGWIASGGSPAMMGAPTDDSEWRKQITSTLLPSPAVIVLDNIDTPLSAGSLARAITADVWSDRQLGASEQLNLKSIATWIATGNNVEVGGDLPRRCYRIRLDAKTSRPWRDREFRHPNLMQWVSENRGRLVWSILTLCRGWFVAGRPSATSPIIGSFEAWSRTVGGILHFAGINSFLANLEDLYEQNDDESNEWKHFLEVWSARYGTDFIQVAQIIADVQTDKGGDLRDSLPAGLAAFVVFQAQRGVYELAKFVIRDVGRFRIRLGKQLKQRVGRRYGDAGLYLSRKDDSHSKTAIWSVQSAGSAGSRGSGLRQGESDSVIGDISQLHDSPLVIAGNTPVTPGLPADDDYERQEREAIESEDLTEVA